MPRRHLRLRSDDDTLRSGFAAVRSELEVPAAFPPDVLEAADAAARADMDADKRADSTDLPFVTVDPPGSLDLDQALFLERRGKGFRVHYAIADVGHFVHTGDRVDDEARRRVQTLYSPDTRTPLYPPRLSEDAASLLAGHVRPALHWIHDLDADGTRTATSVRRAIVRSRERLDYLTVQRRIDDGTADASLALLRDVGRARIAQEEQRGGIDLGLLEQEVVPRDGGWQLRFRTPLPCERWNAQLSLLTGMAAAQLMVESRIGVLRTMPAPQPDDVRRLRRTAEALAIGWSSEESYPTLLRRLDRCEDNVAAFLTAATVLLRGAGYTAFDGTLPDRFDHGAVAAPYAHATAPLRRLVDRFVGDLCVTLGRGDDVSAPLREALPLLPELMADGNRRANALERACVNLAEAAVLQHDVGRLFCGVVVDIRPGRNGDAEGGTVQLQEPAVLARCRGRLDLGSRVDARLVEASMATRTVLFEVDGAADASTADGM